MSILLPYIPAVLFYYTAVPPTGVGTLHIYDINCPALNIRLPSKRNTTTQDQGQQKYPQQVEPRPD